MNILFLATDAFGGKGGIAQSNQDLLSGLAKIEEISRINLVVKNGVSIRSNNLDKIKVLNISKLSTFKFIWTAFKSASCGCSVVICGHINYLYLGIFLKTVYGSKLVLMAHGIEVWKRNKNIEMFANRIDSIWHVSNFTKQKILKWLSVHEDKFSWMPNLIDLEVYKKRPKSLDIKKKYRLQNKKVLLTISRLSKAERYKGHDQLISVMPRLISLYPNIRYLIAGDGDDRKRLEYRVAELGIEEYVMFLGYVSHEEKLDLYSASDVFVMVGAGEGFGLVYLESLACGTPVVGSILDASKEVLLDGKIGELADPGDLDSIVKAVTNALNNLTREYPELIEFSWPKYFARIKSAYKKLLL